MIVQNSNIIIEYGDKKYASPVGIIILCKVLSVVSLHQNTTPPLSVITIAPSGHFKTRTSIEVIKLFPNNVKDLGSDLTMPNLCREDSVKEIKDRTMNVNDLTLLLSTKRDQSKNRLCSGLAELLSEGRYVYRNFQETTLIQARTNLLTNITDSSFRFNKKRVFISNTFIERLLPLFYAITVNDQKAFNKEKQSRTRMTLKLRIKLNPFKANIPNSFDDQISTISTKLMDNTLSESFNRCCDKVKALLVSNAFLNHRQKVIREDIELIDRIIDYTVDNKSNYVKVRQYHKENMPVSEIALKLGISEQAVRKHIEHYENFMKRRETDAEIET